MWMEATVYVHKLSPCDSCAHRDCHVPEGLTTWMKYWHVQYKKRTCCCWDPRIQFQGRIAFCDDSLLRDVYQSIIKLAGTVGTPEPSSLGKAMLHS